MVNEPYQPIEILPEMIGQRLDKALCLHSDIQSRTRAAFLIDSDRIRINGVHEKASYKVRAQDKIEVAFPVAQPTELQPLDLKLDILFEDSDLLVVNKPAGLVVHPAAGHEQDTLVNALIHHTDDFDMKFGEDRPGIVHRLDKETSGVLVVAKNDDTLEKLQHQFKDRSVHRIYFAAVIGTPQKSQGQATSFIARHPSDRKKYASIYDSQRNYVQTVDDPPPIGKWAITNYKRLESKGDISYLQLKLDTGRTHQIRVHLSEMLCPILRDVMYGADKKLKAISSSHLRAAVAALPRFALHAAELGFTHPRTGERLHFHALWPDDMRDFLKSAFPESAKVKGRALI